MASLLAKKHWEEAVKKVKSLEDPWEEFDFESLSEREAIRHVYNPRTKSWWEDEVLIKIQEEVRNQLHFNYCSHYLAFRFWCYERML